MILECFRHWLIWKTTLCIGMCNQLLWNELFKLYSFLFQKVFLHHTLSKPTGSASVKNYVLARTG